MSAVERPTDGPDTELAAAEAWFREDPKRMDFAPITEWSRHLRTIVRAYFARPAAIHTAPKHLLVGDRVETADGVRATVTGSAPRGPHGEPAVNLDWDGEAGGPAYEHDLRRVVDARPAAGRDLTATVLRELRANLRNDLAQARADGEAGRALGIGDALLHIAGCIAALPAAVRPPTADARPDGSTP